MFSFSLCVTPYIMAPSERSELGAYQTITGSGVQPQGAHGGVIYG